MSEEDEWKIEEEKTNKEEKVTEAPAPPKVTPQVSPMKKYVAELIGTLVLVLIGCGCIVMVNFAGAYLGYNIGYIGVSFAFGFALIAMFYAIGGISGCHINPAVSISMWLAGKISLKDTVFYVVFQCVGAIIGAGLVYAIAAGNASYRLVTYGLGQNGYGSASPAAFPLISVFVAETVLTFVFLMVIFSASEKAPEGFAGLAIGLSLTMIYLVAFPIDSASVNPARSLGPALYVGGTALSQLWVFWVAPIIGGIIAAIVWKFVK